MYCWGSGDIVWWRSREGEGIDFPTTVASVLKRHRVVETEIRGEGETIHKYHILR